MQKPRVVLGEVAIHEAGHFVVGHHFGVSLRYSATIVREGDSLGEVMGDGGDWDNQEEAFARIAELLGGYRAQMRVAPLGRCLRGADHDLDMARRILRCAFAEDSRLTTFFKARRETDAILTSGWERVLGLAGLLLEHGSIDAETAEMWLDYASGAEGVDEVAVSRYFALRAVAGGEDLDRESVPPPEDVAVRWKHYVDIGRSVAPDVQ